MEPNSSNPPQLIPTALLNLQHFTPAQISQSSNHHYCDFNNYYDNNNQNLQVQCFGFPLVQYSRNRRCQMVVGQDHPSSISKMARVCRRMARQRRLSCLNARINQTSSNPAEPRRRSLLTVDDVSASHVQQQHLNNYAIRRDLVFNFMTPDNKRLRVLVKKALKNSDVGALGRIVLPKRSAEEHLPSLVEKEGIQMVVREVSSDQSWTFKYKFWSNNNSRMYVLENTGEFVRQKKLGMGDSLTLYEDESKNLYVSVTKGAESVAAMRRDDSTPMPTKASLYPFGEEEEEASLTLLMDQVLVSHEGGVIAYPIPNDDNNREEDASCSWSTAAVNSVVVSAQDRAFDDCYGSLDKLPDVNHYNFSP